ncbi:MAG: FIVAR domain-containing protein, partial [Clostridia bacterium]|nr:FIVAR domain-containing protein [Clostridia bacterium]
AGGIAGRVNGAGAIISNCIVYGDIGTNNLSTSSSPKVSSAGGIIGFGEVANIQINGCVVLSENILSSNMASGAPAYSSYYGTGTVSGSPYANKGNYHLQSSYLSPVIVGNGNADNVKNSLGTAKTEEEFKNASLYFNSLGWDTDVWAIESGVNNGYPYLKALGAPVYEKGSRFNPIEINDKEDFAAFNANVNNGFVYPGLYLRQTDDLDVSGIGRTGYSKTRYFGGHYDGENHKINKFSLSSTANILGLFGYTRGTTISNLTLVKPYLKQTGTSANNVGPLVGCSKANLLIENCAVIGGTVNTQGFNAGGLVGCMDQGFNRVIKSFSTATVTGGYRVGGLAGYLLAGQIEQCYYTGAVTAVHTGNFPAGGLVGSMSYGSKISNCYVKADVKDTSTTVTAEAGGIVGNMLTANETIENCYFYGTLKASTTAPASGTRGAYAGGILAYSEVANVTINNCAVLATEITASASSVNYIQAAHISGYTGTAAVATNCIRLNTVVCTGKKGAYTPVNCSVTATMDEFTSDDPTVNKFRTTLGWNFDDVWVIIPNLNDGLPMLSGLPVDNSDFDTFIANAESYLAEDWSNETFAVLTAAIEAAKADIEGLTPEQKAEHIIAIEAAIEGLRPNLEALQALYDTIVDEKLPYKEWYVSFTMMDAALAEAQTVLEADSNKYKNRDVINTLAALMLADSNLVVNKTELNELIVKANNVFEVDYQPEEWQNLQAEKLVAVGVSNNPDATPYEVMTATEALEAALNGLKIDRSRLEEKIRSAYEAIGATVTFADGGLTVDDTDALAPEKFTNFASFNAVLQAAVETYLQPDVLATTIAQTAYDLNVALNNLAIDRSALRDLYNVASMEQENHYTAESWADFIAAYEAAGTVLSKPAPAPAGLIAFSAEVDEAYLDLNQALKALQVDRTRLAYLIEKAEAEEEDKDIYSDDSWAALSSALTDAKTVYDDENATSAQINAAAIRLNQAILNLMVNIDFLKEKIAEANAYLKERDKGYYTTESMDDLAAATQAAQDFVDLYEATPDDEEADEAAQVAEVKQITADLLAAIDGLAANVEKLQGYIDCVTDEDDPEYSVEKGYAKESVDKLLDLASKAEDLLAGDYSDEQVIKAIKDFEAAFENMQADKSELAALVKQVSGWSNVKYRQDNNGNWILDEDTGELKVFVVYSEESWNAMQTVLALSEGVLNKADATLDEVAAATEDLKAAVAALVIDTSELEMRIEKAEQLLSKTWLYTDSTLAALQVAKQAACGVVDDVANLQIEDVQSALDALVLAINNLEAKTDELVRIHGIAEAQLENEAYYTADSFYDLSARTAFIGGILSGNSKLSADEIEEFIRQLTDVLCGLQVDMTEYDDLSAAFNGLYEIVITDESYAAVAAAYAEASAIAEGGLLQSEDYDEKFAALEELKVKLAALAEAIENVQPDNAKYKQFIADKEALTTKSYLQSSIDELAEVIAAAKTIADDKQQFTYDNVVQNVEAILDVASRMIPDTTALEELVSDTIANLETLHTYTEIIDENGDITVIDDPLYIGIDMYTYEYYTAISYKRLTDAITAAQAIIANRASHSLEDVEEAYEAILNEVANLQVNPTLLEELIAKCLDVNQDYYVSDTVAALNEALETATASAENPAVTLQKYASEYNKLAAAYEGLKFNTDTLDRLIAVAHQIIDDNTDGTKYYSVNSINDLTDALDEAVAFDPTVELTDDESGASYENLCASLSNAIENVVDITDLHDAIEAAKQFIAENPNEGQWTAESYKRLTDAINTAENTFNDDAVTAEEAAVQAERIADPESFLERIAPQGDQTFKTVEGNTSFAFIDANGEALDADTREYDADNPAYLINLALGDTLADICAQFTNTTVKAFKADGETEIEDWTTVIATGMILRTYLGGEMTDEITLVVRGDINGDGKVNAMDKAQLNAYFGGTKELEGAYLFACDVTGDGKWNTFDKARLNAYFAGTVDIYEGLSVIAGE